MGKDTRRGMDWAGLPGSHRGAAAVPGVDAANGTSLENRTLRIRYGRLQFTDEERRSLTVALAMGRSLMKEVVSIAIRRRYCVAAAFGARKWDYSARRRRGRESRTGEELRLSFAAARENSWVHK